MPLHHWNPTLDGPFSEAALRSKLESRGYRVARYTYAPGTVFPDHTHGVDKVDAVVAGRFRLVIGGISGCSAPATGSRSRAAPCTAPPSWGMSPSCRSTRSGSDHRRQAVE